MSNKWRAVICASILGFLAVGGNALAAGAPTEQECLKDGWKQSKVKIQGQNRQVLWRGPSGPWSRGAIIVLHGRTVSYTTWCDNSQALNFPQVEFSALAISQGFAIFALDSTSKVTDSGGMGCIKRWDWEVLNRPNLDLPFIENVIRNLIPSLRPSQSSSMIFMTGLSSGGHMTTRASTHFDGLIKAFTPVSAGDPYGQSNVCDANGLDYGYDNETHLLISEANACVSSTYPNEKTWETMKPAVAPSFKQFHHQDDGIVNITCHDKAEGLLALHGYQDGGAYVVPSSGDWPSVNAHLWQREYSQRILDFFASVQ